MLSFFDLPTVLAIAEHVYTVSGEDHAALKWQLAGAPVLSAHPGDPDKPPVQVYDDRWFSRRWPDLEIGDITAHPLIHPHYTAELFPLADTDQLLAALRQGLAGGWNLLAIDMDETEVTWYLADTRRKKHPTKPLGQRDRRPQHPLLQALTAARFFARNFPPGSDHWTASRWGPRYQVNVTVDRHVITLLCLPSNHDDPAPTWSGELRADVPADIATAIAIAIADLGTGEQPAPPSAPQSGN